MLKNNKISINEKTKVGLILLLAALVRLIGIGSYPGGLHVDEAFSGYEAWSLLNYGTDSWGYHNPVYLTVWGSGMSVLNSVLMIPFIWIGGLNPVTIRLPQALVGILSIYVFYKLLKKVVNPSAALLGMLLLAICPWHIMMSRWGLDCNFAPGFLLFAVYFFVKAFDNEKWLMLSAVFWGLSLYCYATIYIFVPIILVIWGIYALKHKKIRISKYFVLSVLILFFIALPLLLFVAVNLNLIPEIRGKFLSIPKLLYFRSDELGLKHILSRVKQVLSLFVFQNDSYIWNATPYFGMYYLVSMPFILVGVYKACKNAVMRIKNKEFSYEILLLVWCAVSLAVGLLQGINVYKINFIHMAMVILWMLGIREVILRIGKCSKQIIAVMYVVCFLAFQTYYYTSFQAQISERQLAGVDEAIEVSVDMLDDGYEAICATNELRHARVLFYTAWPLDDYLETVTWQNYPDKFLKTASFGCFVWEDYYNEPLNEQYIYIVQDNEEEWFEQQGWTVDSYGYVGVAYKER